MTTCASLNLHKNRLIKLQYLQGEALPFTIGPYRCDDCGTNFTVVHAGVWELQDFLLTESEIDYLERLAEK